MRSENLRDQATLLVFMVSRYFFSVGFSFSSRLPSPALHLLFYRRFGNCDTATGKHPEPVCRWQWSLVREHTKEDLSQKKVRL